MHERSVDGDFLLLELKDLLRTHLKLKVVLMSATINHEVFIKYFDDAPLLTIPGFTHPVEDKLVLHFSRTLVEDQCYPCRYLEDFVPEVGYRPSASARTKKGREAEEDGRRLHDELTAKGINDETLRAIQTISRSDRIDYEVYLYTLIRATSN